MYICKYLRVQEGKHKILKLWKYEILVVWKYSTKEGKYENIKVLEYENLYMHVINQKKDNLPQSSSKSSLKWNRVCDYEDNIVFWRNITWGERNWFWYLYWGLGTQRDIYIYIYIYIYNTPFWRIGFLWVNGLIKGLLMKLVTIYLEYNYFENERMLWQYLEYEYIVRKVKKKWEQWGDYLWQAHCSLEVGSLQGQQHLYIANHN